MKIRLRVKHGLLDYARVKDIDPTPKSELKRSMSLLSRMGL